MAIPKKYKKQLKSAFSGATSTSTNNAKNSPKHRKIWALKVGDLVECADGDCAIIVQSDDRGYYRCLSSVGSHWRKATKLVIVQKGKQE